MWLFTGIPEPFAPKGSKNKAEKHQFLALKSCGFSFWGLILRGIQLPVLETWAQRPLDPVPKVGEARGREFHVSVCECCSLISSPQRPPQQGPEGPATKCQPYPI